MLDKAKILIAEEIAEDKAALNMILQHHYQVYSAEKNGQVLELIYKYMIDVVILNLRQQEIHPIEIIKAIKRHDPDIEIIISGYSDKDMALMAFKSGVSNYFSKPFRAVKIISLIKKSLEKRMLTLRLKDIIQELIESEDWISAEASCCSKKEEETLIKLARRISYHFIRDQHFKANDSRDYLELAKVLSTILESKDYYTHGHSERVSYYSGMLAERLNLNQEEKINIQIAAYLHDIGKLGLNDLLFTKKRLNHQEWDMIRQHPEKGIDLIESLCNSRDIISAIRHHHERYDGRGYPYGLAGESIPLGGRIIAIADSYDAITSQRPYRGKTMSYDEAQKELLRCAGTQFDPNLAHVFIKAIKENNHIPALT
jgi:response regulator RpfG family c-di-GMP phosphodiesterase